MSVVSTAAPLSTLPFAATEVRAMLAKLLASAEFAKAQRMSKLLSYLVEMLLNRVSELNEYMIGIEVFARHPATYNTGDDPIVRVQVGRLRARLRLYYASGKDADLVLTIPLGGYLLDSRRGDARGGGVAKHHLLAFLPLACLSDHADGTAFTRGLNEQLTYQLFVEFGNGAISPALATTAAPGCASHHIAGSLRRDGDLTRVAIRLVDAGAGCIAWSRQFDVTHAWTMALQEKFAELICEGLRRHFADQ